jgi:two-component system alkaline phosphatase synthesis response regulator PhoP
LKRIILIDDSEEIYLLVKIALAEKYEVCWVESLRQAELNLKENHYDLILLDVMLPDGDGFNFCVKLQNQSQTSQIPVIFVTAKTGEANLAMGFALGADDYIEKPFGVTELQARVESKLKKISKTREAANLLIRGDLKIELENQTVSLSSSSSEVRLALTPIEFKLLCYLAMNDGRVLSRDQLMTAVWGDEINVSDRTVDKHVSLLRQKLIHCADYIETVSGFGYKFTSTMSNQKAA